MSYRENPKTRSSGIVCCIPQRGRCPVGCEDCFFQSGRSYLEPLDDHTPNMPSLRETEQRVVHVNDGNDSNHQRELVLERTQLYRHKFYNTSIPRDLDSFGAPVVLTVNPGRMTDERAHMLEEIPLNLMFVRFRANTWNTKLLIDVIRHYADNDLANRRVPVVITFMSYYTQEIPEQHQRWYTFRKRVQNSSWVITQDGWNFVRGPYRDYPWVRTCGLSADVHECRFCGTCLREYFATAERLRMGAPR
jgi:hypothetical protein